MRKSTIIVIIAIYLLSILVISYFGIKVRVYDEVKYVKSIEISVNAESEAMFELIPAGQDSLGNHIYYLNINFDKAQTGEFEIEKDGVILKVNKSYVRVSLIPYVTYDTDDIANAKEESLVYKNDNQTYQDNEWLTLDSVGFVTAYRRGISTIMYVKPAQSGRVGADAIIYVSVN